MHLFRSAAFTSLVLLATLTPALRADAPPADDKGAAREAAIAKAVAPAIVQVEVKLKFDKGEEPYGGGWGQRCPNCGEYHTTAITGLVNDERPLEIAGFVVGADRVILADPMLQPRFIESVNIRVGEKLVPATLDKVFTTQRAIELKTASPLEGIAPLSFSASKGESLFAVVPNQTEGRWQYSVKGIAQSAAFDANGKRFVDSDSSSVVVDESGAPVTLAFGGALDPEGKWKAAPAEWPTATPAQVDEALKAIKKTTDAAILRVHLSFRSPKTGEDQNEAYRYRRNNGDEENATERDVLGVLVGPQKLIVLAELNQGQTARLQKVTAYGSDGKAIPAEFESSYKDFGAIVVKLAAPREGAIKLAEIDLPKLKTQPLYLAEIEVKGEQRTEYFDRRWIADLKLGWRRQLVPDSVSQSKRPTFVFNDKSELVSLPILHRDSSRNEYATPDAIELLATYLKPVIADSTSLADSSNIPLSEEDEARTAWLGVELQSLTADLARLNKVSELTDDGESGALVTFVYPDSPAAKLGINPGAILLRLWDPSKPTPIKITADQYQFAEMAFPWDRYAELPEQYFDRVPRPWPPANGALSQVITKVGFGKQAEIEFVQNGKTMRVPLPVEISPAHYDTAKKFDHSASGLTVRDMTYELRRYFQIDAKAPGVIISNIEAGSKASRIGLKPFEYITQVNNIEVHNVAEFEKAAKDSNELKLSVKRYMTGRAVTIKLDAPTTAPGEGEAPSTQPAKSE